MGLCCKTQTDVTSQIWKENSENTAEHADVEGRRATGEGHQPARAPSSGGPGTSATATSGSRRARQVRGAGPTASRRSGRNTTATSAPPCAPLVRGRRRVEGGAFVRREHRIPAPEEPRGHRGARGSKASGNICVVVTTHTAKWGGGNSG